jgi:hypothetical protein
MMKCYCLQLNKYFYVPTATIQRGDKKIGDKCDQTTDCGFDGAVCTGDKKPTCQCLPELTASNHIDKCGKRTYPAASRWERVATSLIYETWELRQLYG